MGKTMQHRNIFDGRTLGEWISDNMPVLVPPRQDDARWQLVCENGNLLVPDNSIVAEAFGGASFVHENAHFGGCNVCDAANDHLRCDNDRAYQIDIIRRAIA